jgi:hypothetical protein
MEKKSFYIFLYLFWSFVKVFRQEETHFVGTTLVWCAMKKKSFYIF